MASGSPRSPANLIQDATHA